MKVPPKVRIFVYGFMLLVILAAVSTSASAQIGIGISVRIGPPALPVYEQPICPAPGYLWTPGYWAWSDDDGYYWVPGTWVEAPEPGLLWTPGYWGWNEGVYVWNAGYWGPQVGFYGGINYGFGYGGNGFYGGEWRGGAFFYNTAVVHVNTTVIRNVYINRTVIVNNNSHVAFNGGQGGIVARPTPQQEAYAHVRHTPPVAAQMQQEHAASRNRALFASTNHGRPAVAATAKPGEFSGRGVVTAKAAGAPYHAPAISPREARASAPAGNRAGEKQPVENRPAENRPAESHPASPGGAKAADRPFVPPNTSNTAKRPEGGNVARENAPRESAPRSEAAPRTENARPSSEPRSESKPSPAPKARESAPKASPRRSAPKPEKSAPPKRETAPPKEEHKG